MNYLFGIYLSHDPADQSVASFLKHFLLEQFRGIEVHTSGVDLLGELPLRPYLTRLKTGGLLISLISRQSQGNPRLHFEAGAGAMAGRVVVLLLDGVQTGQLRPPLGRLPAVNLDEHGLRQVMSEIASGCGVLPPPPSPESESMLWEVKRFLSLRQEEERQEVRHTTGVSNGGRDPLDATIQSLYRRLKEQVKLVAIRGVLKGARQLEVGGKDELKAMSMTEVFQLGRRHGLPLPELERGLLLSFEQEVPGEQTPRWKKLNAFRVLEAIDEGLRAYERTL